MVEPATHFQAAAGLLPDWAKVALRMQSGACTRPRVGKGQEADRGMAVVSIHVLVDGNGKPVAWTEPECNRIEPQKLTSDILRFLARR